MFDPYIDASPQIDDETFTDPVGAVKKRLAQLELARQQRTPPDQPTPGWEGVRPRSTRGTPTTSGRGSRRPSTCLKIRRCA
jgi:hypothetical protein